MPNRFDPTDVVRNSINDARELIMLHPAIGNGEVRDGEGRRAQLLERSCLVLISSAWETFVEDATESAIEHLIEGASDFNKLPKSIMKLVANRIKADNHMLSPWEMAGEGWRNVARKVKNEEIRSKLGMFNTPKPGNVDALFKRLLDIPRISDAWSWDKVEAEDAREKLTCLLQDRGAIAHGREPDIHVDFERVYDSLVLVCGLSLATANALGNTIATFTGTAPWDNYDVSEILRLSD